MDSSDLFDVVHRRRSVRSFSDRPVSPGDLERILDAVRAAPTAGNMQAFLVVRVTGEQRRRAVAQAALNQMFVAQAPELLVFVALLERSASRYRRRGEELYALQDATIAATHAHLAAEACGLGSCWVGAFREADVAAILGLRPGERPVALLPIGYSTDTSPPTSRRPLEEMVVTV